MNKPIDTVRQRLRRDRPMASATIHLPEDVIEELQRIAPLLGISSYQSLIRAYIGRNLREDLAKIESSQI